jgi:hypothetical protein
MGKRSSFERIPRDFYPTPYAAVPPLIPHLRGIRTFAEPCWLIDAAQPKDSRCRTQVVLRVTSAPARTALAVSSYRRDYTNPTTPAR